MGHASPAGSSPPSPGLDPSCASPTCILVSSGKSDASNSRDIGCQAFLLGVTWRRSMGDNDTSQAHIDIDIRCLLLLTACVKTLLSVTSPSGGENHGRRKRSSKHYQFALPGSAQRHLSLPHADLPECFKARKSKGCGVVVAWQGAIPAYALSRLSMLDIRASTTLYHVLFLVNRHTRQIRHVERELKKKGEILVHRGG